MKKNGVNNKTIRSRDKSSFTDLDISPNYCLDIFIDVAG